MLLYKCALLHYFVEVNGKYRMYFSCFKLVVMVEINSWDNRSLIPAQTCVVVILV